jgi:tight adherence protein C
MVLVLIIGVGMLAAAIYLVADLVTAPVQRRRASIARATRYSDRHAPTLPALPAFSERVFAPLGLWIQGLVLRVTPQGSLQSVEKRLLRAGLGRTSPALFIAAKALLASLGVALGLLAGTSSGSVGQAIVFMPVLGVALWILPDRLLAGRIRNRQDRIQAELPDCLDLLAVSVEAGLGLDGAISMLIEHMEGALADEFALTLGEMRIGEGRAEALRKLAERAGVAEVSALTRAIIQADQLGTSLGRILRVQARDSRIRRQTAAEERANKTPVKMLFPTAIFIFPALFLVVVGPAFITIVKSL